MKIAKRISAFIITLVLILGMLPMPAFAEDEPQVNDEGYYLLGTAKDLMRFFEKVNNGENSINAELTANIDLSAEKWRPIGYETTYCASFKENGFKVTLNKQYDESCDYFAIGFLDIYPIQNGSITVSSGSYPYVVGIAGGINTDNRPAEAYAEYIDADLRDSHINVVKIWQEAYFSSNTLSEQKRKDVIVLKYEMLKRIWKSSETIKNSS